MHGAALWVLWALWAPVLPTEAAPAPGAVVPKRLWSCSESAPPAEVAALAPAGARLRGVSCTSVCAAGAPCSPSLLAGVSAVLLPPHASDERLALSITFDESGYVPASLCELVSEAVVGGDDWARRNLLALVVSARARGARAAGVAAGAGQNGAAAASCGPLVLPALTALWLEGARLRGGLGELTPQSLPRVRWVKVLDMGAGFHASLAALSAWSTLERVEVSGAVGAASLLCLLRATRSLRVSRSIADAGVATQGVPLCLYALPELTELTLEGSGWSGLALPQSSPGASSALRRLRVADAPNLDLAPLPAWLNDPSAAPALAELEFPRAQVRGAIPAGLSARLALRWLDLSENMLSGGVPPELSLRARIAMNLSSNALNGTYLFPSTGPLPALDLVGNRFSTYQIAPALQDGGGGGGAPSANLTGSNLTGPVRLDLQGMDCQCGLLGAVRSLRSRLGARLVSASGRRECLAVPDEDDPLQASKVVLSLDRIAGAPCSEQGPFAVVGGADFTARGLEVSWTAAPRAEAAPRSPLSRAAEYDLGAWLGALGACDGCARLRNCSAAGPACELNITQDVEVFLVAFWRTSDADRVHSPGVCCVVVPAGPDSPSPRNFTFAPEAIDANRVAHGWVAVTAGTVLARGLETSFVYDFQATSLPISRLDGVELSRDPRTSELVLYLPVHYNYSVIDAVADTSRDAVLGWVVVSNMTDGEELLRIQVNASTVGPVQVGLLLREKAGGSVPSGISLRISLVDASSGEERWAAAAVSFATPVLATCPAGFGVGTANSNVSGPVRDPAGGAGGVADSLQSADHCQPCGAGTYSDGAMVLCHPCPYGTVTVTNQSKSVSQCSLAAAGFYEAPDAELERFDHFYACVGDVMQCSNPGTTVFNMVLQPGFWRPSTSSLDIYRCQTPAERCAGGPGHQLCSANRSGALCSRCADGFGAIATSKVACTLCSEQDLRPSIALLATLFSIVAVLVLGPLIYALALACARARARRDCWRSLPGEPSTKSAPSAAPVAQKDAVPDADVDADAGKDAGTAGLASSLSLVVGTGAAGGLGVHAHTHAADPDKDDGATCPQVLAERGSEAGISGAPAEAPVTSAGARGANGESTRAVFFRTWSSSVMERAKTSYRPGRRRSSGSSKSPSTVAGLGGLSSFNDMSVALEFGSQHRSGRLIPSRRPSQKRAGLFRHATGWRRYWEQCVWSKLMISAAYMQIYVCYARFFSEEINVLPLADALRLGVFDFSCLHVVHHWASLMFAVSALPVVFALSCLAAAAVLRSDRALCEHFVFLIFCAAWAALPFAAAPLVATFKCFQAGSGWYLVADVSFVCEGEKFAASRAYAAVMGVVYVVGVPLLFFVWLRRMRHVLIKAVWSASDTEEAERMRWIHFPYTNETYWFEAYEQVRKVVMVLTLVLLKPWPPSANLAGLNEVGVTLQSPTLMTSMRTGSMPQVMCSFFIAFGALFFLQIRAPYRNRFDLALASIALVNLAAICITLLVLASQVSSLGRTDDSAPQFAAVVRALLALQLLSTVVLSVYDALHLNEYPDRDDNIRAKAQRNFYHRTVEDDAEYSAPKFDEDGPAGDAAMLMGRGDEEEDEDDEEEGGDEDEDGAGEDADADADAVAAQQAGASRTFLHTTPLALRFDALAAGGLSAVALGSDTCDGSEASVRTWRGAEWPDNRPFLAIVKVPPAAASALLARHALAGAGPQEEEEAVVCANGVVFTRAGVTSSAVLAAAGAEGAGAPGSAAASGAASGAGTFAGSGAFPLVAEGLKAQAPAAPAEAEALALSSRTPASEGAVALFSPGLEPGRERQRPRSAASRRSASPLAPAVPLLRSTSENARAQGNPSSGELGGRALFSLEQYPKQHRHLLDGGAAPVALPCPPTLLRLGVLGSGAGGVVHLALHIPTLELVALKEASVHDASAARQIARETASLVANGQLTTSGMRGCRALVGLRNAFWDPDEEALCIAMEFVRGGTLQDTIDRARLNAGKRLRAMSSVVPPPPQQQHAPQARPTTPHTSRDTLRRELTVLDSVRALLNPITMRTTPRPVSKTPTLPGGLAPLFANAYAGTTTKTMTTQGRNPMSPEPAPAAPLALGESGTPHVGGKQPCRAAVCDERMLALVAHDVLSALAHMHDNGYVHLDVKPTNVLVSPEGRCKLADLGLAQTLREYQAGKLGSKFVGTLKYLSPERLRGEAAGFSSDIWSVGLTLLALATGTYPLAADEGDLSDGDAAAGRDGEATRRTLYWHLLDRFSGGRPLEVPEVVLGGTAGQELIRFSNGFRDFVAAMLRLKPDSRPTARQLLANRWLSSALHAWEAAELRDGAMQPPADPQRFEQSCKLLQRIAQGVAEATRHAAATRPRRDTVSALLSESAALPSAALPSAVLPSAALPSASSAALPSAASAALPSAALPSAALPSAALPSAALPPLYPGLPTPPHEHHHHQQHQLEAAPNEALRKDTLAQDALPVAERNSDLSSVCSAPQGNEPLEIELAKVAHLAQQLGINLDVVKYALSSKCVAAGFEVHIVDDDDDDDDDDS